MEVKDLDKYGKFDVILTSPPCNCFSILSVGKYWKGGTRAYIPKNNKTKHAVLLVQHILNLIEKANPKYWILENPRAVLRKLQFMQKYRRMTVTYCQYGKRYMKPTDLWGIFPKSFIAKKCKNGDSCHERASRGSKTGVQSKESSELRAKIPYGLSLAMCVACEKGGVIENYNPMEDWF